MQPVETAAVENKGKYTYKYEFTASLLVIDFTFMEGQDGELVVKELAAVDFHRNRVSSCVFKIHYGWEEQPLFNARMN